VIRDDKLIREGTLQDWVNGRLPVKRKGIRQRIRKLLEWFKQMKN
jgi:hypothetical protein